MVKKEEKSNFNLLTIGLFLVLILLGYVSANNSSSVNSNYESLLTPDQLELMLSRYFDNLNVTTNNEYITNEYISQTFNNFSYLNQTIIYNETTNEYYSYNYTTNEYTIYNITEIFNNEYISNYLNETYNDYVTNEYYEDNYYNTFNEFNQTYLNQTFIDNEYYEYNTYNSVNQSTLESIQTQVSSLWDLMISNTNNKIDLEGQTNILLTENNCSRIEFMFRNTGLNGIFDNNGLIISTQLAQLGNINFVSSFFVDTTNSVITNNVNLNYDTLNTGLKAIQLSDDDSFTFIPYDSSVVNMRNNEVLFNIAFDSIYQSNNGNIFVFEENNVPKFSFSIDTYNRLVLKNLATGVSATGNTLSSLGFTNEGFKTLKIVFSNSQILLYNNENENLLITLNSNPFSVTPQPLIISEQLDDSYYDEIFLRSFYINSQQSIMIGDKMLFGEEEFTYDKSVWNKATIYLNGNDYLYHINNNVRNKEYVENIPYFINFDLTKIDLSNLYCYK